MQRYVRRPIRSNLQSTLSWIVFVALAFFAAAFVPRLANASDLGPCGRPYDTRVDRSYGIEGTWMFGRDHCAWQDTLERFHRAGGNTVLQFGARLEKRTPQNLKTAAEWGAYKPNLIRDCRHPDGTHCVDRAQQEMDARGLQISNWLTWDMKKHHGTGVACQGPSLDRQILVLQATRTLVFWRLVLPHDGQTACSYAGGQYDILFLGYELTRESEESDAGLLEVADALGIDIFLASAAFPTLPADSAWAVDPDMRAASLDWSRRLFRDYEHRHGHHPSFKGVYQSFEVHLSDSLAAQTTRNYESYGLEAALLHSLNAARRYSISPYLGVNKRLNGDLEGSVEGFKRLARLGVDVVIPQDGRGTGKGALFWPYEANKAVASIDPMLGYYPAVDANDTFASQWNASVKELFDAMADGKRDLSTIEGIEVDLWTNIEAFEKDTDNPDYLVCSYASASATNKHRLDRALTMASGQTSRIVSFMYDPFFTCTGRFGSTSLIEEIESDHKRPVISKSFFWDSNGQPGMVLRGYHVAQGGTTFRLTWYDSAWQIQSTTTAPGWTNPLWGNGADRPQQMQEVWIPFDRRNLAANFYVHILAKSADGHEANHIYSHRYGSSTRCKSTISSCCFRSIH